MRWRSASAVSTPHGTRSKMSSRDALALARDYLRAYAAALDSRFELARHHKLLIQQLERVESRLSDRLMIFMPPRHGKSLITSTMFPAWYLGRHPERSIIATSYGA